MSGTPWGSRYNNLFGTGNSSLSLIAHERTGSIPALAHVMWRFHFVLKFTSASTALLTPEATASETQKATASRPPEDIDGCGSWPYPPDVNGLFFRSQVSPESAQLSRSKKQRQLTENDLKSNQDRSKSSKIDPRRASTRAKIGQKGPGASQSAPRAPQERPWNGPRAAKSAPREPKSAPREPEESPKSAKSAPRAVPELSKGYFERS